MIENRIIELLFEGNESLVVKNDEKFHLEDYIEYFNKPGLIVATIKGDSECGIQQLPIGAVDNFRFMQITNEDAILNQNKNSGKSYDQILKEYEVTKCGIIDQWKKMNSDKFSGLRNKYGNRFLGMDIVENKKKIEYKEEVKDEVNETDKKIDSEQNIQSTTQEQPQITEDELVEGIGANIAQSIKSFVSNIGKNLKDAWDDTRTGLRLAVNSPFAAKSVKMLSKCILSIPEKINDDEIKLYCNIDGNELPLADMSVTNISSKKFILLYYTNDESGVPISLDNFSNKLEPEIKKNLTVDITGIIGYNTDVWYKNKQDEKTGQYTKDKEVVIKNKKTADDANKDITSTQYKPIVDIQYNNGKVVFTFEKSRKEKRQEKRRKTLYK